MKIIKEFEPSDIDLKDNLHSVLATGLLVGMISINGISKSSSPEEMDLASKKMVATFLNMLERSGFAIVPKDIPSAFFSDTPIS